MLGTRRKNGIREAVMPDNEAIARAKADILEFDRKINTIEAEQVRLEAQKRQMSGERDRIKAFVEMYQRYATDSPAAASAGNGTTHTLQAEPLEVGGSRRPRKRAKLKIDRKPEGIPAMPVMITAALREAKAQGRNSLEPKEMTAFIRAKWWPHVKGDSVSPIAWRMAQLGQLRKDGSTYALPTS